MILNIVSQESHLRDLIILSILGVVLLILYPTLQELHTLFFDRDHGYNSVAICSVTTPGSGYGNGTGATENLYNAVLGPNTMGQSATARVTVNAAGELTWCQNYEWWFQLRCW
jgi:hypothetical protein